MWMGWDEVSTWFEAADSSTATAIHITTLVLMLSPNYQSFSTERGFPLILQT